MKYWISHLLLVAPFVACQAPRVDDSTEVDPKAGQPIEDPARAAWTRWGRTVDPERPRADYPRPSLVRERWVNLNGRWQFEPGRPTQPPPFDRELLGSIVVPFAPEAPLSGVEEHHEHLWYKRRFQVPTGWHRDRLLIHFGAVDWQAEVWVNGRRLALHEGGFDPFTIDVTEALLPTPEQELLVRVFDPTDGGQQMRGNQALAPGGTACSPVSGIWRTVWMEPLPRRGVDRLVISPSLETGAVSVTARGEDLLGEDLVEVEVLDGNSLLAARRGRVGEELVVPIPAARAWSPEDPFLYDLRVTRTGPKGQVLERVRSYFGLRTVGRMQDASGATRFALNGEPRFLTGVLDPGLWPDGLYTPPSDEAIREELLLAKTMGFDLVRKHLKVEPERWYFWADRLGLLVWQDIPSAANETPEGREQFERELAAIVSDLEHHPSLVGWVLFHEGRGQYDTPRLATTLAQLDSQRLVTATSGWVNTDAGDVVAAHHRPGPALPNALAGGSDRLLVLGEYGGVSLPVDGHTSGSAWGYQTVRDAEELALAFEGYARELRDLQARGLDAAIYTQLTDVGSQTHGLVTFDREVVKVPSERLARANRGEFSPLHTLLPTSQQAPRLWRMRTDAPPGDWTSPYGSQLDLPGGDEGWTDAPGGFGSPTAANAPVRTAWEGPDLFLSSDFQLGAVPAGELCLFVQHSGDLEVWINGERVLERTGPCSSYVRVRTGSEAAEVLRPGANRIVVHARHASGPAYVDVGLEAIELP